MERTGEKDAKELDDAGKEEVSLRACLKTFDKK